ncbi:MAG: 2'-5' RNA ligase family protein [Kiloniellales bacterium]|nr:2'-5' RNA ligase family protein [Kiloniellales bacterium]
MPLAISLCLDPASADRITELWRSLTADGLHNGSAYRPHITLGLYDTLDVADAKQRLERFVAGKPMMAAGFSGLGVFPGENNILWAMPDPDLRLLGFHAGLHDSLGVETHPHYRVGKWVPHCTLATDLDHDALMRALTMLVPRWKPFLGWFDRIDLVRFDPVEVLWRFELTAADDPV